ncbi:MAG: AAA family ATPase [Thermoanaerobaculia bacterium]
MTVTAIDEGRKKSASPMFEFIGDAERDRTIAAQEWVGGKYSALKSWEKVAELVGISGNATNAFYTGSYNANPKNIVRKVERAQQLERDRAANTFSPEFVSTSVAKKIIRALRQTRARGQLGTLAADSGCGTSTALREMRDQDESIVYVACNPTLNVRPWPVLALILARLGAKRESSPFICYEKIVELLRGRNRMIALDEAQQLQRPDIFDTLRRLSEDAETPIFFAGNRTLLEFGFLRGASPAAFTQFTRRCGVTEVIRREQITKTDVTLVAGQRLTPDVLDSTLGKLVEVAHGPGAIGTLHLVLQRAHEKAGGGRIDAAQIFDAIDETAQMRKGMAS